MTTPAQYEAAIRALEKLLAHATLFHVDRTGVESALAIVREAREREADVFIGYAKMRPRESGNWRRELGDGSVAWATERGAAGIPAHKMVRGRAGLRGVVPVYAKQSDIDQALTPEVPDAR